MLLHSTSWSANTRSTLPALLGNLEQKSRCKPLGSWLGGKASQRTRIPFSVKSMGLFEIKSSLTKTGLNYRSEILSRTAEPGSHAALCACASQHVAKAGERVGGWLAEPGCATLVGTTSLSPTRNLPNPALGSLPIRDPYPGSCWAPSVAL